MRKVFWTMSVLLLLAVASVAQVWPPVVYSMILFGPIIVLGAIDCLQTKQTLRRNFPLAAHLRYLMELLRPEINQYFIESNKDGVPFDRERRSIVYQRAKGALDTLPFGTQGNVYAQDYEWINHSMAPRAPLHEPPRVHVGGARCTQPYSASLLNISAMSYGALSSNAIRALNGGAKLGGFAHNTGEGGLSSHHLEPGGDIIWQLGTAYFGCRNPDGTFSAEKFQQKARLDSVKMIEIKLSQGAKPGHGGILPAGKLSPEIVEIRGVNPHEDCVSPPAHSAFDTPLGLIDFVEQLRQLSGGKPVGFKLCIGKRREFLAVVKAMLQRDNTPDFITIDGGEGGTGAAPLEFSNSVGTPLKEGLVFAHNALVGVGLRDRVRIIAAGKIITGFNMATTLALGADLCNSARAMMFALGCIQALRCNSNRCPTGVATQDPALVKGLYIPDKVVRVRNFQRETVHSLLDVVAAAGLAHPGELRPWHIMRRTSPTETSNYGEVYPMLDPGDLLRPNLPRHIARAWEEANPTTFQYGPHRA
jgi:glutamate synthase domain-containing protein 2